MKGLNKQKLLAILLAVLMLAGHAFIAPEIVSAENGELQPGEVRTYKTATPVPGMVNTWDIKLRVEGRDKEGPAETTRVVLVIDRSGSMQGTRMTEAKNAAKEFVKEVLKDPNLEVAIVSFSSKYDGNWQYPPSELVTVDRTFTRTLTGDQGLNKAIDDLVASGGTHTQAGILKGKELLDALPATIDNKIMVLLSDGLPTFSYEPLNWDIVEATGTNTSSNRHQWYGIYDGHFDESTVVGTGSTLTQSYDQTLGTRPNWVYITKHINNGSAAIRAASDTKASIGQNNLFTIAVGTDATGTDILRQIASQNRAYSTNNPSELEGIYGEIAGIITSQSAVRSAVVTDEMGDGFSVVTDVQIDTFGDGTTELKAPAGTTNQTIKWTFPELKKLVVGTDDIRYAEMTYRIEINPSILDPGIELAEISVDPNHHLYWTNKSTVMTYTNSDDNPDSASFESPKVDPVFLKIKKILTDNQGNLIAGDMIADNLTFDVEIKKSSGGDSANFPHTEALVPNAEDPGYVWLTTLRHEGTYSVEEIGVSSGSLSEYDISYKTDGVDGGTTFEVNHVGNIPRSDIEVEVTNRRNVALVSIGVEKTLSGRPGTSTKTDKFGFVLTGPKLPVDGVKKELTFAGNGTKDFRFDSILFTSIDLGGATTKDFFYTVTEDSSQPIAGITYDENLSRTVTVTLSKDNQGRISAAVDPATVSFTNHYEAEGVEVELGGTKTLENRNKALGDDEFEFALYKSDVDGIEGAHVETVSNVGGIFKFSKLDFDAEGTYYYLIKEVDGGLGWFTYDTKEYLVKVVIADNDEGKLEAAVSYYIYDEEADPPAWVEAEVAAFTNSYLAEGVEVELGGTKTLENRNKALGDDEFEFALYKSDVDGIEGAHVETVSNVGGIFKFSKLDFDAEGTYYYLIKEVDGGLGWFTYDTKEYLVKVVITDNDEGKLEAVVTYWRLVDDVWVAKLTAAFTNSYLAEGVEVELGGTKTLENRNKALGDDEFEFALYKSDVDGIEGAHVETVSNVGGIFKFSKLSYADGAEGTYYYLIKEVDGGLGWFTYDTKEYLVKVVITDNDEGKLEAAVSYYIYDGEADPPAWVEAEVAAFTNSYLAEGVEVELGGTKTLENRNKALGDDEFEFALYKSDVDGIEGAHVETVSNVGGIFKFSKLDFDAEGTYYYLIKEVDGGLGWFTYDTKEYLVKVVITDNDEGKLEAAVSYYIYDEEADPPAWVEAEVAAFTNSYLAEGVEVELGGTKTLENRNKALGDDEFEFALYKSDVDGIEGAHVETVSNVGGIFKFSKLDFDAEGTYYYLIKEVDGGLGWFTYDTKEYLVKVVITDNDEGKLEAVVTYWRLVDDVWVAKLTAAFTNSYLAEGVEVELGGTKTLENRNKALGDDEFEFALYKSDVDGIEGAHVETVSNVGGIFKFSKLDFDAEGTYYYLIKEVDGGLGWFTYDTKEYLVKVVITDNDEGKLEAAVSYYIYDEEADPPAWVEAEVAAFTNSYLAEGVEVELGGTKTLENRNKALGDDEFEFALYKSDVDGIEGAHVETVSNVGGIFKFSKLDFDAEGTYYYLIKEVDGGLGWFTYDTKEYLVKVVITDNDEGKLEAAVSYYIYDEEADPPAWVEAEVAAFTNSYLAEGVEVELGGTKTLENRNKALGDDEFEFALYKSDVDGIEGAHVETVSNVGGIFKFSKLDFDAEGTYYYLIKEVDGGLGWFTYDTKEYLVKVVITDNDEGKLEAVVTYWRLVDDVWVAKLTAAFTNSYLAEGVEVELGGTKTLENRNKALGDDEFEFALYKSDVDGIEGAHVETVSNVGGIFKFSKLDFDAEGTYYYLIKEVDGGLGWFTYDTKEYLVKVVIADNDEGKLEAAVSYYIYDEEADPPAWVEAEVAAFTNSYLAEGVEVELGGTKTLENRNKALGDDEFEFALYKSDVDGIEGAHVETVSNVGGIFKFSKLSYADGAEGTYYYLIKEVDGGLGWFTYDTKEYLVKVVITDNDEGKLEAAVSYYIYDGEADPPAWVEAEVAAFTNSYLAEGVEVELGGTKTLLGRDKALGDDEFEFALYKSDVDGIEGAHVETVSNVGGIFKFSKLSYADGAEGTYYYLIKEVDGGLGWFTYDTKEYLVKVVITDNDEGKLEAAVSYYIYDGEADPPAWVEAEVAAFTNSYLADGEWMPEVRKELTGRSLKPGEFSFELNGDGLNHALAATNDGAGRVVFKPIKYTEQDVGKTYYYTVEEIQGNLGGVTYDKHVLKIKVEVKDFENGELDLRVTYDGSTTFTNRYNASGAYAPVATKVAVDFTLEAGQFEFELVDPLGNVLRTAKNTALGGVQFAPLEFGLDDIGKTFVYTIREVEGTLEKIIYDDTEYTLTLTVSDQGDGTLLVQRKAGEAPAIFTNLLEIVGGEEDEIPDDGEKTPATGQQISVYTYLAAAMLVLAVVSAILALKPRKKDTTA